MAFRDLWGSVWVRKRNIRNIRNWSFWDPVETLLDLRWSETNLYRIPEGRVADVAVADPYGSPKFPKRQLTSKRQFMNCLIVGLFCLIVGFIINLELLLLIFNNCLHVHCQGKLLPACLPNLHLLITWNYYY